MNKNDYIMDEFENNVHDGLKAAFDADNINVSEDLIQRTLKAIRVSEDDNVSESDTIVTDGKNSTDAGREETVAIVVDINRIKHKDTDTKIARRRFIRYAATIAAALIIVFMGFKVFPMEGKKEEDANKSTTITMMDSIEEQPAAQSPEEAPQSPMKEANGSSAKEYVYSSDEFDNSILFRSMQESEASDAGYGAATKETESKTAEDSYSAPEPIIEEMKEIPMEADYIEESYIESNKDKNDFEEGVLKDSSQSTGDDEEMLTIEGIPEVRYEISGISNSARGVIVGALSAYSGELYSLSRDMNKAVNELLPVGEPGLENAYYITEDISCLAEYIEDERERYYIVSKNYCRIVSIDNQSGEESVIAYTITDSESLISDIVDIAEKNY